MAWEERSSKRLKKWKKNSWIEITQLKLKEVSRMVNKLSIVKLYVRSPFVPKA
jgi:hypothetical protein